MHLPFKHHGGRKVFLLAFFLLLVSALAYIGGRYVLQLRSSDPSCLKQGFVDTGPVNSDSVSTTVAGWVFNSDSPVVAVSVQTGETELLRHTQFVPRADVSQIHAKCRNIEHPGFSFSLPVGKVPVGTHALNLVASLQNGSRYSIGSIAVDLSRPLAEVERPLPITRNSENLLSGWAVHPDGAVKVRLLTGTQLLWEGAATHPRDDVAGAFPAWPTAGKSAFEFSLSAAHLPLIDAETRFEFIGPNGTVLHRPGPPLRNQEAIGKVLADGGNLLASPQRVNIRAWAWHDDGISTAYLETEQGKRLGKLRQVQPAARLSEFNDPRFPPAVTRNGFDPKGQIFSISVQGDKIPKGLQRLVVRVRDGAGKDAIFPGPLILTKKNGLEAKRCEGSPYLVYLPGVDTHNRASGPLEELQRAAHGACVSIGIQTRIEYLRTTRGQQHDFAFDPDFPESLRRPNAEREMLSSSLNSALAMAVRYRVPINLVLDGGVWADSKFSIPEYDIVDWLEQDEQTVQWNQWGKSEPDDALKSLAGSQKDPELARMMSLNRYNTRFMNYKKRNLQSAVRVIAEHNRRHPDAVASINLDPDEYINPWFKDVQWYDYNPGSIRQFREWLLHTGPYADGETLAAVRSPTRYDLISLRKVSGKTWASVDEIDPPREKANFNNEWKQLWIQFKRHLVAQHYADLATWASEAGLPERQIRTSQTFLDSRVATYINEKAQTWSDEAGVSIEGAKPAHGHIGAIFYGAGSRNEGEPRNGESLIDNVRLADPQWGLVEMHPGNISTPHVIVSQEDAYRTMLTLINYGVNRITPMWGSSAGDQMVHPDHFRSYDVFEQSPFETQFVWWLQTLRHQPWGGQLWPFGNDWVKSVDGWQALESTTLQAVLPGHVELLSEVNAGFLGIRSPSLRLSGGKWQLQVTGSWPESTLTARGLLDDGKYINIVLDAKGAGQLTPAVDRTIRRIELQWQRTRSTTVSIDEIRLVPLSQK